MTYIVKQTFLVEFVKINELELENGLNLERQIILGSILSACSHSRSQHVMFDNLSIFLSSQKKYEKRVGKLEEFIDECYSSEKYPFKRTTQTGSYMRNMIDDFFKIKNLLVN